MWLETAQLRRATEKTIKAAANFLKQTTEEDKKCIDLHYHQKVIILMGNLNGFVCSILFFKIFYGYVESLEVQLQAVLMPHLMKSKWGAVEELRR